MMIYRRDPERAHRGYEHRAVKRADVEQRLREQSEIIKQLEEPHGELFQQSGNVVYDPRRAVEVVFAAGKSVMICL